MAGESESDSAAGGRALDLRRVAVALAVVAAHVALIIVMGRGTRNSVEVVEVTFFPLPIAPEEWPAEPISTPAASATEDLPRRVSAARAGVSSQIGHSDQPAPPSDNNSNVTAGADSQSNPTSTPDWYAETQTTVDALEKRAKIAHERRRLDGPNQTPMAPPRYVKPECPFEQCEPNWGAGFSVFESQQSKAGRIEKTPDGEVIRWTSDSCYQILVTPNLMHRGMTKCQIPLGKDAARGDLFKHMKEPPPPEERAMDVP